MEKYILTNMEKDQIILLEDRGLISIVGEDVKNFLQNIITNDIEKVSSSTTIFSALLTPQGKYLFEFFLIKSKVGYLLDCDSKFTSEIINCLSKYKLRSKVKIKDVSNEYVVGIITLEMFLKIQKNENKTNSTIEYRGGPLFIDPRNKKLGARIVSSLNKLHLTIKNLKLKIIEPYVYFAKAHSLGVPVKGVENLKDQLFGLEANFEELKAIDFHKGCFVGQENTARMKLKNKLRKRLFAIEAKKNLRKGAELTFEGEVIGRILIDKPCPFAIVNLKNSDNNFYENKELNIDKEKIKLIYSEKN